MAARRRAPETARGMRRAAALEFAAQGAAVFGCDLDEKASEETVRAPAVMPRRDGDARR